jgi:ketopantoate hydroxymethyltransferase
MQLGKDEALDNIESLMVEIQDMYLSLSAIGIDAGKKCDGMIALLDDVKTVIENNCVTVYLE